MRFTLHSWDYHVWYLVRKGESSFCGALAIAIPSSNLDNYLVCTAFHPCSAAPFCYSPGLQCVKCAGCPCQHNGWCSGVIEQFALSIIGHNRDGINILLAKSSFAAKLEPHVVCFDTDAELRRGFWLAVASVLIALVVPHWGKGKWHVALPFGRR